MKNRLLAAVAALLFASPLAAEITIQIDRGYDNPKKIGVVPFGVGPGVQGVENPNAIIAFDLARSGQFSPTPPENMLSMPTAPKDVLFRDWRVLGVEYVVIGRTEVAADGNLAVSYYLFDVLNERQLANETFTAPPTALRDMAHLVSDAVYEKLTGIPGAYVKIADTVRSFKEIIEGKHDAIPEQAFYLKGGIEDVLAAAEKMQQTA